MYLSLISQGARRSKLIIGNEGTFLSFFHLCNSLFQINLLPYIDKTGHLSQINFTRLGVTIQQFRKDYPNDAACLDKLFQLRSGNLEVCPCCAVANPVFRRLNTRRAYQCRDCYHQIYPTAGTIFQKTNIPLTCRYYVMYLMTVTRNGVPGKELERTLGITYKSAFRMAKLIRELMGRKKETKLTGTVEMDETYVGGIFQRHPGRSNEKIPVFAMVECNSPKS